MKDGQTRLWKLAESNDGGLSSSIAIGVQRRSLCEYPRVSPHLANTACYVTTAGNVPCECRIETVIRGIGTVDTL